MSDEQPSAILGTTATVRTMADGGMKITIDISPPDMKRAFELFGMSGTNIALARVTQVAAQSHTQRSAIKEMASGAHGKHYATLYKGGWWFNPRVKNAFDAEGIEADGVADFIKARLHADFGVTTMADVSPESFRDYLKDFGILDTLPAAFGA